MQRFGAHLCNILLQTIVIPLALAETRRASDGINEAGASAVCGARSALGCSLSAALVAGCRAISRAEPHQIMNSTALLPRGWGAMGEDLLFLHSQTKQNH